MAIMLNLRLEDLFEKSDMKHWRNSVKIPLKFRQNMSKNHRKEFKNNEFLQNFAKKIEKMRK